MTVARLRRRKEVRVPEVPVHPDGGHEVAGAVLREPHPHVLGAARVAAARRGERGAAHALPAPQGAAHAPHRGRAGRGQCPPCPSRPLLKLLTDQTHRRIIVCMVSIFVLMIISNILGPYL